MHCLKTDIVLYILTQNLYIFTELVVWLEYLECDDENIDDDYNMMTLQSMMLVVCAYIDDDGEHLVTIYGVHSAVGKSICHGDAGMQIFL